MLSHPTPSCGTSLGITAGKNGEVPVDIKPGAGLSGVVVYGKFLLISSLPRR
jgi:hypothetical protein